MPNLTRDDAPPCPPKAAHAYAVKAAAALSYVPCILMQLDEDAAGMFAIVMQAMREGGYEDGYRDGVNHKKKT